MYVRLLRKSRSVNVRVREDMFSYRTYPRVHIVDCENNSKTLCGRNIVESFTDSVLPHGLLCLKCEKSKIRKELDLQAWQTRNEKPVG